MKRVNIDKCEIEIIECDCGYHLGVDSTFINQVGDFKTKCPSCEKIIDTIILNQKQKIKEPISKVKMKKKPTIQELEAILDNKEDISIIILPSGEISTKDDYNNDELNNKKPITMREDLGSEYSNHVILVRY